MVLLSQGPTFYSTAPGSPPIHSFTLAPGPEASGTVVVFFHGLGMHARAARHDSLYAAFAARGAHVYAWDCPHHGTSSRLADYEHPSRPRRLPKERHLVGDAQVFVGLVRALHPHARVVLVGESLGAAIAFRIATSVTADAVCGISSCVPNRLSRRSAFSSLRAHVALLRMVLDAPASERRAARADPLIPVGVMHASVRRCILTLLRNTRYDEIRCPILFVVGTNDRLFSVGDTMRAFARCTGVSPLERFVDVVPGGRHDSTLSEAREVCATFADLMS